MSHPVDVHVGKKIKQVRRMRRLSQTDVANQLNLSFQQIQKYEIGSNRVSASRLYELAKVLSVPISYFFDGLDSVDSENDDVVGKKVLNAISNVQDEQIMSRIVALVESVSNMNSEQQAIYRNS